LIELGSLENADITKPTLVLTHHSFFNDSSTANSAIRNAYGVFSAIENKNIIGILHGHTHGYKDIIIGNKCRLVGVAPFLEQIPGINNQANLISVYPSGIRKIVNYRYQADIEEFSLKIKVSETVCQLCEVKAVTLFKLYISNTITMPYWYWYRYHFTHFYIFHVSAFFKLYNNLKYNPNLQPVTLYRHTPDISLLQLTGN
jgi:hypothetical protein